jgi:prophage regulatory protein
MTTNEKKKMMLRAPEVAEMLSVSKATVWGWAKAGKFPGPIKLGANISAWRRSDIEAWIEERAQESA